MAHMSSLEKAQGQMKKLRKQRAKKTREFNKLELTPEEIHALEVKRMEKTLMEKIEMAIFDYERHQYPPSRYTQLSELLREGIKDLNIQLRSKFETSDDYSQQEKEIMTEKRNANIREKINKFETILKAVDANK